MIKYSDLIWDKIEIRKPAGTKISKIMLDKLNFSKGRALDIGCATGDTLALLIKKGFESIGIDHDEKLVQSAKNKNLDVFLSKAEDINFPNKYFNLIISECTISLCDSEKVLKEIYRLLDIDGKLIISDIYEIDKKDDIMNNYKENGFELEYFLDFKKEFNSYIALLLWHGINLDNIKLSKKKISYFSAIFKKEQIDE